MNSDEHVRRALDVLTAEAPPVPALNELATRRQAQVRRRRTIAGSVVACIAVAVLGVTVAMTNRPDGDSTVAAEAGSDVAVTDTRAGTSAPPATDEIVATPEPACGPGLPGGLSTPDPAATEVGPAPGAAAALDGQTVIHWTAGDDVFELRWPAGPQPLYGAPSPGSPSSGISSGAVPEGLRVDVGGPSIGAADTPDLVFTDLANTTGPGCDVVQLSYWSSDEHAALGLRLLGGPSPRVELVDVGALIVSTVEESSPPQTIGCDNPAIPNRSGTGAEQPTPQPSSAEALQHFLQTDAAAETFAKSGWTEFPIDSTTVTYGWETSPGSGDYAVSIETSRNEAGWIVDAWSAAGC